MRSNFEEAMDFTFKMEGAYSNDKRDRGGETCFGISRNNFPDWEGWQVIDDLKEFAGVIPSGDRILTEMQDKIYDFYKKEFWDKLRCDDLPSGVDLFVFDCGVNQGVGTAAKCLQYAVKADEDGIVGSKTLANVAIQRPEPLLQKVADRRFYYYMLNSATQARIFGTGWGRRYNHALFHAVDALGE